MSALFGGTLKCFELVEVNHSGVESLESAANLPTDFDRGRLPKKRAAFDRFGPLIPMLSGFEMMGSI